jgi:hypothetical protein
MKELPEILNRCPLISYFPNFLWAHIICVSRYSDGLHFGRPGFDSRQGQEIVLLSLASGTTLGPTQPPIQWVPGAVSPWVKRSGHEANNSPSSSGEVKNGGAVLPYPHTSS